MTYDQIRYGVRPRRGWVSVTPGAHVRADLADDLAARLNAWQLVLPYWTCFTGLTVANLRGWWIPPIPTDVPYFLAAGRAERIDRRGLAVCRHPAIPPWEFVGGVRATNAAETLLACSRELGLLDVVLLGDAALHLGQVTRSELLDVARQRRRGAPQLRRAIPWMDARAESIYEGLLRLLHLCCRVPVEPQFTVLDSVGEFVARADLRIVGTDRLPEYDGADHLSRRRQRRDLRRVGRLTDAGFDRRGYTMEDVLFSPTLILRDADRALGRPHDPTRIEAWHALVRESLFSDAGRYRLLRRLGLVAENAE